MASEPDYPVLLNNFFQEHPTGNLTPFFHYALTREGPDDKVIHTARVMFRGTCYGVGRGRRTGLAKSQAAREALEYFEENDIPEA